MRGENGFPPTRRNRSAGSPPHARGKPVDEAIAEAEEGITPACAGKTCKDCHHHGHEWDHPRMRGEN